jgi:hypothetical protein
MCDVVKQIMSDTATPNMSCLLKRLFSVQAVSLCFIITPTKIFLANRIIYVVMCLRPLNKGGKVMMVVCAAAIILCCALSFTATWWRISFWDCDSTYDSATTHFSLLLNSGLCSDSDGAEKTDFQHCQSWQSVKEDAADDSTAQNDAALYEHAWAMCIAALVVASIIFSTTLVEMKAPEYLFWIRHSDAFHEKFLLWTRHLQMLGFCSMFLMLMFNIALLADTWYTEPDHYAPYEFCDIQYAGPDVGLFAALFAICVAMFCGLFLIFPCAVCLSPEQRESRTSSNPLISGGGDLSTNLLAPNPTAPPVGVAVPVSPNGRFISP